MDDKTRNKCAQWWADRLEIESKRELFKEKLLPKISDDMWLKVDYDPNPILRLALEESGIEANGLFSARGIFPSKTSMDIYEGIVEVKEGYGAPDVVIARYDVDNS